MTTTANEWAKIELFGHTTLAGRVCESAGWFSPGFVRIDVPAVDGIEAFSQYVNLSAIYRVTPLSEEVAMLMAHQLRATPYSAHHLPGVVLVDMSDNSIPF